MPVGSQCNLIAFHSRHDLTLARLAVEDLAGIVGLSGKMSCYLQALWDPRGIEYLGWVTQTHILMRKVHTTPSMELASRAHYATDPDVAPSQAPRGPFGRPCLLCEYVYFEVGAAESESRVVVNKKHFVAIVPWWAYWRSEVPSLHHLTETEQVPFASILSSIIKRLRQLILVFVRVLYGLHQRSTPLKDENIDNADEDGNIAPLHVRIYPHSCEAPPFRSRSSLFDSYELLAKAQRDIAPGEQAAGRLGACLEVHYVHYLDG
ncbi:hypothetical protein BC826DRAFT_970405 [Russula brevipes]|nr:hypothetical protein BC826DRAFT_970405 [Russula brevipes]